MTIFLILAPYATFAGLMLLTTAAISVFASAAVCVAVIGLDIYRGRSVKMLGAGSVIVFVAIGAYLTLVDTTLSNSAVKLATDIGMLLISLGSIAARCPFTLQYALEATDAETAKVPGFMRANYIITWAWTASVVLMMLGNMLMIYVPGFPLWSGLLIAFAARNSAIYFTKWYPQHCKEKYGPAASALPVS